MWECSAASAVGLHRNTKHIFNFSVEQRNGRGLRWVQAAFTKLWFNGVISLTLTIAIGATAELTPTCERAGGTTTRTDYPWCVGTSTMKTYLLTRGQRLSLHLKGWHKRQPWTCAQVFQSALDWKCVVPKFLHKRSGRKWFILAC